MFGHIPLFKRHRESRLFKFDRKSWKQRNKGDHSMWNKIYIKSNSRKEQKKVKHASGIHYSCLSEQPYFDCSRMCIVDPMHNLQLGTVISTLSTCGLHLAY